MAPVVSSPARLGAPGPSAAVDGGEGADVGAGAIVRESRGVLPDGAPAAYGPTNAVEHSVVLEGVPVDGPNGHGAPTLILPLHVLGAGDGELVARIPGRVMVGEALLRAGGTPARYRTSFENGGFICTVASRVPRRCHVGCSGVLSCRSGVMGSITEAEEAAAAGFLRALRSRRGVVVADANLGRVNRMRRQLIQQRVNLDAALTEKQQAVEKGRLMEQGWLMSIDDLLSIRSTCRELCSSVAAGGGPGAAPAEFAQLLAGVEALSARVLERTNAATARLMTALGQAGHAE